MVGSETQPVCLPSSHCFSKLFNTYAPMQILTAKVRGRAQLTLPRPAGGLQDTVAEMAKDIQKKNKGQNAATAQQLYDFMGKVRAGLPVSNVELTKFAPLFNDELTLDNLERVQLQSMLTVHSPLPPSEFPIGSIGEAQ
eukprot:scaffold288310_cov30-Prasinocladus_malaysianus.AAC.1